MKQTSDLCLEKLKQPLSLPTRTTPSREQTRTLADVVAVAGERRAGVRQPLLHLKNFVYCFEMTVAVVVVVVVGAGVEVFRLAYCTRWSFQAELYAIVDHQILCKHLFRKRLSFEVAPDRAL